MSVVEPATRDVSRREGSSAQFKQDLVAAIPKLRAVAVSLSGNADRAGDLVQETLTKALHNAHLFQPGTNLLGWLYTLLRNTFYSEYRKRRREVPSEDGKHLDALTVKPEQEHHIEFLDFRNALLTLPPDQREALVLVGASGMSYEEAAEICKCAVGTIKSRVSRARLRLSAVLGLAPTSDES
jgi:RNA polymerase sigma-70 factor (ECF subfamily)